jgi:Spy/CpxP family protein refolding chaperone
MTKAVVIVGFIIAFTAGLVVGIESLRTSADPPPRSNHHRGWLAAELGLSSEQQEQLKEIWSKTAERGGRDREERRRQLFRQRDEAIVDLIRPEDKPRYEAILKNHADKLAALDSEWRSSFRNAVEQTKQILTPEQRAKYEQLLKHHEAERGFNDHHRGERGHEMGKRGGRRGASRPASQP